jgi:hypothetical protein
MKLLASGEIDLFCFVKYRKPHPLPPPRIQGGELISTPCKNVCLALLWVAKILLPPYTGEEGRGLIALQKFMEHLVKFRRFFDERRMSRIGDDIFA